MIGNDVIDLELTRIESNWQRKGFLEKLFSVREQKMIQNAENSELMVWNLWSRKEAAYKIIIQKGGKRGYYPIKIECLDGISENGIVMFEKQLFYTKTYFKKNFVYSEAVENNIDFENIVTINNSELIFKENGIPFLKLNNKTFSVSKTHHGIYEKIIYLKS